MCLAEKTIKESIKDEVVSEETVKKVRVVKSKSLAGALVWFGYPYTKDEEGNFIFERTCKFDLAFKALHSTRAYYSNNAW